MLHIAKSPEPAALRAYRESTPQASYAGLPKPPVRAQLLADQGALCAYCTRRIHEATPPEGQGRFTIEHWSPQSSHPGRDLHWPDLLAVCDGWLGGEAICDKARGDKPLTLHPARDPQVEEKLRYGGDGRLFPKEGDAATLNLNAPLLRANRKAVLDIALQRSTDARPSALRAEIARWEGRDPQGNRLEYAGAALSLLRRALRAAEDRAQRTRAQR